MPYNIQPAQVASSDDDCTDCDDDECEDCDDDEADCDDGHADCPEGDADCTNCHADCQDGHADCTNCHADCQDGHADCDDGHADCQDGDEDCDECDEDCDDCNCNYNNAPDKFSPGENPNGTSTGLFLTGVYNPQNIKDILIAMGILIDGQYRENVLPVGVYNFVEKYTRTSGNAPPGLYCYNFCLDTNQMNVQPSGAMNMSRFTNIQFEFTTVSPPIDPYAQVLTICDPTTGDVVGINKPTWRIYNYNYDMQLFEERVNVITFVGGNAGLMYAT